MLGWEGVRKQAEAKKLEWLGVEEGRTVGWVVEEMTVGLTEGMRAQLET